MQSEQTIYDNAVDKRFSSSSEENFGLSDDSLNNENYHATGNPQLIHDNAQPVSSDDQSQTGIDVAKEMTPEEII